MSAVEQTTKARSADEVLVDTRVALEPAMRTAVDALPASMHPVVGYHLGWLDERSRPTKADTGKAFRPALVLLSAAAVGDAPPDAAVPAAVAIELVHNFSLLHDDVMDGDLARRHRATAWSVFGTGAAILAGDSLLTLAFDVLAATSHPAAHDGMRMLSATVQELVEGQSADAAFEQRDDVGLAECMSMAEAKTGALMGCACALGALFGGGSQDQVGQLRGFGRHLGLAFQLVDDLLGIWGDPAATGKPVHADLGNHKKSLPVVAALVSGTSAGRALAAIYQRPAPLSGADLLDAAELIDTAGGRDWSQAQADEQRATALRWLALAAPTERAGVELAALAHLATHRQH